MIYKEHFIELFVNGERLELESQEALDIRFNDVLSDPTKISSTQAEYSFEFDIPSTPNNDRIFDYANNLAKTNKFHHRYNAELYADGTLIFEGTLTLNSVKEKIYSCNLVSVKLYSLEDIFGDMTMDKIKWEIPFNGATTPSTTENATINYYNMQENSEVVFPLASYGVFQKDPYFKDEVRPEFTPKFDIDKWNRWYIESFYPSANVLETLKKAFETVDYTVTGDAFHNPYLTKIYMSGNLADEQSPDYNLGNPNFGMVDLSTTFTTEGSGYEQELAFPYFKVHALVPFYDGDSAGVSSTTVYNWDTIYNYDLLDTTAVTMHQDVCYMYQPNEHVIVIPADGFYKIEMTATTTLNTSGNITVAQNIVGSDRKVEEQDVSVPVGLREYTPIEVALVRNYEDNYELIKGKNNKQYGDGNPLSQTTVKEWLTCFPHEDLYNAEIPTKQNDLTLYNTTTRFKGLRGSNGSTSGGGSFGGQRGSSSSSVETRGGTTNHGTPTRPTTRHYSEGAQGYVNGNGEIMCYDQAVSPIFICGFSSFMNGTASVMKNGYSWAKISSTKNEAFYPEIGYDFITRTGGTYVESATTLNYNTYINTPIIPRCNVSDTTMNGQLSCIVYLNKNDVLQLMGVQRGYHNTDGNPVLYSTTTNVDLKIRAFSPRNYDDLKATHDNRYEAPVEFPVNLQVANFFNKETLVSEWVQGIIDAFNLQLTQSGNTIDISTKKNFTSNYAVELDNRVNTAEAESQRIDYPRSMAVKYKIDDDEWGFERSAILNGADMNRDDWRKYGDSGYTNIELNDDTYVTEKSEKSLQFSYTWYDNFNWFNVNQAGEQTTQDAVVLRLPVISNYSYMIDGYDYEESMKHDGYGLAQRFWFRPTSVTIGSGQAAMLWTATYPRQYVLIYTPKNFYNGLNLSYKTSEKSLLDAFFDIKAYLGSNFVKVDVYLTAEEYKSIKNGALVHFDSDLYIPIDIEGYDPTGYEKATLTMMKKLV